MSDFVASTCDAAHWYVECCNASTWKCADDSPAAVRLIAACGAHLTNVTGTVSRPTRRTQHAQSRQGRILLAGSIAGFMPGTYLGREGQALTNVVTTQTTFRDDLGDRRFMRRACRAHAREARIWQR